jgi:hypothetical protein
MGDVDKGCLSTLDIGHLVISVTTVLVQRVDSTITQYQNSTIIVRVLEYLSTYCSSSVSVVVVAQCPQCLQQRWVLLS